MMVAPVGPDRLCKKSHGARVFYSEQIAHSQRKETLMNASNLGLRISHRVVFTANKSGSRRVRLVGSLGAVLLAISSSAVADVKEPHWKPGDQDIIVLAAGGGFGRSPDVHQQQQSSADRRDPYSYLTCCSP